ncbi:putative candidate carboxylesterase from carbohydrate esterase family ce10 protein [Neofusicoccum parvum UCRNP2]|uniref:Carboxylic ester hydrolase n=1 Tax=Botryosphaeria parva (strain UCR-NP2) TaxID=1287680 RepID=R1FWJ1_BOTPV|nr:putative candidate carboxylesterase from carbohydrate esterase family ce10 protein [Neofusicoccum parvum UCRNP2]
MRVLDWLAPGVSALSVLPAAQAAPSPGSIGSDLTILAYNDLYGNQQVTGYRDKLSFRFEGLRYAPEPERFAYSILYEGTGNASALSPGAQCVQSGCTESTCRGTGSDPTFDGGNMASRGDVVVVTINYRLSTLGFLALDDGELNGNYGLADQIIALDWVHAHIKDFGGDPDRITIFGQSAGAASVRALLASPKAIGKYQAAISQSNLGGSNYATTYSQYYTIEQEVAIAANPILNETGCADASEQVECLRSFDAFELVGLSDVARYLVVDGAYLTTPFLTLTGTGPAAHVPILTGVMRDDAAAFISYPQANDTLTTFLTTSGFPSTPNITDLFPIPYSLYPTNTTLAIFNATARLATDAELRCLTHATAYSALKHSVFPRIFAYEFARSYQPPGYSPNAPVCEAPRTSTHPAGDPTQEYFKCHSGELYYVFGNLVRSGLPLRDEGDVPFAQHVLDAWTAFARTGDPNPDAAWVKMCTIDSGVPQAN